MAEEEKEDLEQPESYQEPRGDAASGSTSSAEGTSPSSQRSGYGSEVGVGAHAGVPGVARRRNRPKDPNALRNDPGRMMAGARIRRDVRRRVDQALADQAVVGEGGTNYSLLVESLLLRWLDEVGYPVPESRGK
jgi:hypothetical protein